MDDDRRQARLSRLRVRARRDDVRVEDLLGLVAVGDASLVPVLEDLKRTYAWPEKGTIPDSTSRLVPLGRWADYIRVYLAGGRARMVAMALDHAEQEADRGDGLPPGGFALGVLEASRSAESVLAVVEIGRSALDDETRGGLDLALRCASTLNLLISAKRPVALNAEESRLCREFLHSLLKRHLDDVWVATIYYALRGCGDGQSVCVIASRAPLSHPWAEASRKVVRTIRSRLG